MGGVVVAIAMDEERKGRPGKTSRKPLVSRHGKILEIHQERPGRVHVVLIRQSVGI